MKDGLKRWLAAEWRDLKLYGHQLLFAGVILVVLLWLAKAGPQFDQEDRLYRLGSSSAAAQELPH